MLKNTNFQKRKHFEKFKRKISSSTEELNEGFGIIASNTSKLKSRFAQMFVVITTKNTRYELDYRNAKLFVSNDLKLTPV